ncbi:MAG: nucleotidyltransferase family protein [Acidobacteriia bacterium]|nr:nucleotidyltransferase family protein [Terriglobia bacterium]
MKLQKEAVLIVENAQAHNIEVRILGSVAIATYVGAEIASRPSPIKDIDLITRHEARTVFQGILYNSGWRVVEELLLLSEDRETYQHPAQEYTVDVYFDVVDGNHPIHLRDRLGLSFPAISATDLLMTKLQRRFPRQTDTWDCCALFTHGIASMEVEYFVRVMGKDWGLYTTALDNLRNLIVSCPRAREGIRRLMADAERGAKSWQWYVRSVLGRRLKWWNDVFDTKISEKRRGSL